MYTFCAEGGCGRTLVNLELKDDRTCLLTFDQHWMGSEKISLAINGKYRKITDQLTILSFEEEKTKDVISHIFHLVTFSEKIIVDTDFEGDREFLHCDWAADAGMLSKFTPCRGFDAILIAVETDILSSKSYHLTKVEEMKEMESKEMKSS